MTTTKTSKTSGKPWIICVGANGRAVVYGRSKSKPRVGKPCTLTDARMLLYFGRESGGLFGVAATGPSKDSRITAALAEQEAIPAQVLAVSEEAAAVLDAFPVYRG